MTLLVVGADRVDAGKTTFTTGLIAYTDAVGFKPRAGNDWWFHHDDCHTALDASSLYGADARKIVAAAPGDLAPEMINPVHRLWRPAPAPGPGLLGQDGQEFLLDRAGDRYVLNGQATLPSRLSEQLPLANAVVVESVTELNAAIEQLHLPALDALKRTIKTTDRAVVESYGDVARPVQGLAPTAVAVVEPKRVRVYDGHRYGQACQVATGASSPLEGQLEESVSAVTELIDPATTVETMPLRAATRAEPAAIADAYERVYRRVLDVAGW
jgi:Predicted P-loop ATPase/GTPase